MWIYMLIALVMISWRHTRKLNNKSTILKEPIYIRGRIPSVTHIVGILRHGAHYYRTLSQDTKLRIFALRVFSHTIYVVTDTILISKLQRAPTISFDPFVLMAAEVLSGSSTALLTAMRKDTSKNRCNPSSIAFESHHRAHTLLRSHTSLLRMTTVVVRTASKQLQDECVVDLYQWVRHTVCLGSTNAVYGPENPFNRNPRLENVFWEYESGLSLLLLNLFPRLTARKGCYARGLLRQAFAKYFRSGGASQGSDLVRNSHEANIQRGISDEDQGGFEIANCIGLLVNTPPTLFWMLLHIYSNDQLLHELRVEVENALSVKNEHTSHADTLDIQAIMAGTPRLKSTLNEVLRVHASSLSTRVVLEDTTLDDNVLLRKGSLVHMPSIALHHEAKFFGIDPPTFNAHRFMKDSASGKSIPTSRTAFRPFGGGTTLCPGRHFAKMQILSITAYMILRYEMLLESGEWNLPDQLECTMTTTVLPPCSDVRVRFQLRKDSGDRLRDRKEKAEC